MCIICLIILLMNFILDEIINKLKKEDLDKLEKFKKNIFDFFK